MLAAAQQLPEEAREHFIQAFNECRLVDIYGGDLAMYMAAIADTIKIQREQLDTVNRALSDAVKLLTEPQ